MSSGTMTSDAKRALAKSIRGLRAQLIDDLGRATEQAYRLSIDAKKAQLDEVARVKRGRLEGWIDEQIRALPAASAKDRAGATQRLMAEVVKDAAATLLLRLVYLRLLEASGLSTPKVVTGGWDSRGYKDFREVAPELTRSGLGDETEGYATLLGLMFDELAHDLPGLYGSVRMTSLVPVPAATLRAVVDALNHVELTTAWTDDTTLGWIYQYWNDPEREAIDLNLAASKKLENHEIASKTQMFTERYMVEWLLHNTLGQMWLAMCKKNGWAAEAETSGVLARLEQRRIAWRTQRESGEVAGDALMPIEAGLEERWKYWVPQPMPDDSVTQAPTSIREVKLLDPACGSGHFLVIAFELLFALHQEEARHLGATVTDREIVELIVERNLYGIDIDPKAVQIAAAALMLKARQMCADAMPEVMNLVAPALRLASLADDDPARRELDRAIEIETGIPPELTERIVSSLAGADHLGTLLQVDKAIDTAIDDYGVSLSTTVRTKKDAQGSLFDGFVPVRPRPITTEHAKAALLDRLESFLSHHTSGADLGLRLRGEQLAVGVRFVRMIREGQYDIVIGNPPYQGTSKMADKAYVEKEYPRGKADLYAAFLERSIALTVMGGMTSFVTRQNWLFTTNYSSLRMWILEFCDLRLVADLGWSAFDSMRHDTIAMYVIRRIHGSQYPSTAISVSDKSDREESNEAVRRKSAVLLAGSGRHTFSTSDLRAVPEWPVLYWWSK